MAHHHVASTSLTFLHPLLFPGYCVPAAIGAALAGRSRGEEIVSVATVGDGSFVRKNVEIFLIRFGFGSFPGVIEFGHLQYIIAYNCLDHSW